MNSSKKVISVIIGSAIFCSIQANNVNHDVSSKDARSIFQQQVEEKVENQNFVAFHDDSFAVLKKIPSSKIALEIFQRNNHYPHKTLVLGGNAEASVQHSHNTNLPIKEKKNNKLVEPKNSSDKTSTSFALKEVGINTMVNLNQYMTSYIAASAVGNNMSPKIDDIFMLVSNNEIAPVYFTVGKSRIPFGVFAGGIWTDSITKMLFQPNRDINASFGVYTYGIGADITLFKKDNHFSNIAITASYDGDIADVNYKIQGGYISDVKGSGNAFNNPLYENAKISRIGAVNFDASVNYNIFTLGAGWAQTTDKFNLANDGHAGAWYVSSSIAPEIYDETTTFSLSYHGAYNTRNIPIALNSIELSGDENKFIHPSIKNMGIFSIERPIYKNKVFVGSEYAYMRSYNKAHNHAYTIKGSFYF